MNANWEESNLLEQPGRKEKRNFRDGEGRDVQEEILQKESLSGAYILRGPREGVMREIKTEDTGEIRSKKQKTNQPIPRWLRG